MVIWSDSVDDIISSTLDLEGRLLKLVWRGRNGGSSSALNLNANTFSRASMLGSSSRMSLNAARKSLGPDIELTEKVSVVDPTPDNLSAKDKELEAGAHAPAPRPTRVFAAIYIGIAVALSVCRLLCTSYAERH
jgi:hypothetical protein